jgi:hypothetical protein
LYFSSISFIIFNGEKTLGRKKREEKKNEKTYARLALALSAPGISRRGMGRGKDAIFHYGESDGKYRDGV